MDLTREGGPVSFRALMDMHNQYWVNAKEDWLAIVDGHCNAYLFNPYSCYEVQLPPITRFANTIIFTRRAFDRTIVR